VALLALWFGLLPNSVVAQALDDADRAPEVDAQTQYDAGEFDAAIEAALVAISNLESQGRPFHPDVVD